MPDRRLLSTQGLAGPSCKLASADDEEILKMLFGDSMDVDDGAGMQRGKRKASELDETAVEDADRIDGRHEYQTSTDMYAALKAALKTYYDACLAAPASPPRCIAFHGSYSIIADPKIPPWKLVKLVAEDLKRIVKFPHADVEAKVIPAFVVSWSETYRCDCSRSQTVNSPISTPTAPLKHVQTDLSRWILSKRKTTLSIPTATKYIAAETGCGGKVRVSVLEDNSHAIIKGHKVIVEVEH